MGPRDIIRSKSNDEDLYTIGRKQFPSREAFKAYDRVAYTIKKIVKAGPQ